MDANFVYNLTAWQMGRMLNHLASWVAKAEKHAIAKTVDPVDAFMQDQQLDRRPVLSSSSRFRATLVTLPNLRAPRLSGKEPPKHPDTEKTFGEVKTRIQSVIDYLKTFKADDFKGAADRRITQMWMEGKYLSGTDFLQRRWRFRNFLFSHDDDRLRDHARRANGVDIGKADYIGLSSTGRLFRIRLPSGLAAINSVVLGKPETTEIAFATLLAKGSILIEDRPGFGKTTLAKTLARVIGLSFQRIQCTNDLLPMDILGRLDFTQSRSGQLIHGPIFASVVLLDELNRAPARNPERFLAGHGRRRSDARGTDLRTSSPANVYRV